MEIKGGTIVRLLEEYSTYQTYLGKYEVLKEVENTMKSRKGRHSATNNTYLAQLYNLKKAADHLDNCRAILQQNSRLEFSLKKINFGTKELGRTLMEVQAKAINSPFETLYYEYVRLRYKKKGINQSCEEAVGKYFESKSYSQ